MRKQVVAIRAVALPVIFICAAVCGCTGDGGIDQLQVVETSVSTPARVGEPITVLFNHPIQEATVDDQVLLANLDVGIAAWVTFTTTVSDRLLTITPAPPLLYDTNFQLTLLTGIGGIGVMPLSHTWEKTFRTELPPPTAPPVIAPFDVVRHGIDMYGVWANDEGSVVVGDGGLALFGTETGRWALPSGTKDRIHDVWCSGTGVVYLASGDDLGGKLIRHRGGESQALHTDLEHPVRSVHGVAPFSVLATAGDRVLFVQNDLVESSSISDPELLDVWSMGGSFWAAGTNGIYHSDDLVGWTERYLSSAPCVGISGTAADDIVGVAGNRTIYIEGSSSPNEAVSPSHDFSDVSWTTDRWGVVVGSHDVDGAFISQVLDATPTDFRLDTPETLRAVSAWLEGSQPHGLAVGDAGFQTRTRDGVGWELDWLRRRTAAGEIYDWTDLCTATDSTMYAIRSGELLTYLGGWSQSQGPADLHLSHVHCDYPPLAYVVGTDSGGIDQWVSYFHDGDWNSTWMSSMDLPSGIWGSDRFNIFVSCDYGIVHRMGSDPAHWTVVNPYQHLHGIWGVALGSVWTVGNAGTIVHYNGSKWVVEGTGLTTQDLHAIHGSASNNILVVGDGGTVLRNDGTGWADFSPGGAYAGLDLRMVWTSGPTHIWAGTESGAVIHYDGDGWTRYDIPVPDSPLRAIALGDGDLWFAGDRDLLCRFATAPWPFPLLDYR